MTYLFDLTCIEALEVLRRVSPDDQFMVIEDEICVKQDNWWSLSPQEVNDTITAYYNSITRAWLGGDQPVIDGCVTKRDFVIHNLLIGLRAEIVATKFA